MPLAEKELETLLWEHPLACQHRGLTIHQDFFAGGRRYRNLSLGPYGSAQLVNVRFAPDNHGYYVQVIHFCTGAITLGAYQKAKRHLSALHQTLERALRAQGLAATIRTSSVLIGRQVQLTGDLVFLLNLDANCQAFTYRYEVDGVYFNNVGTRWHLTGSEAAPALQTLAAELLDERAQALAAHAPARTEWLARATAEPGERSESLVVTAGGILENRDLSADAHDEA